MKKLSLCAIALATAAVTTSGAHAQTLLNIPIGTWNTQAELGAINTTGNTEGTSVTGKIDAKQELESWSNEYIASGYFKEDKYTDDEGNRTTTKSADRYALSARAAYKLIEQGQKLFALASHVSDKFGAYTKYSSLSVGYSSILYKSPDKSLEGEIGPGYFKGTRYDDDREINENGMTVRGAASFKWQVSQSALFTQTLSVERGTSNTHTVAETALSAKIIDRMQMKAAFAARSDSNVADEKKKTDTQTSLTLVYSF
jgi:putative salt-induced outer membrane protein YdiY